MAHRFGVWATVVVAVCQLSCGGGCGEGSGDGDGPGPDVEWFSEGSGPANESPLAFSGPGWRLDDVVGGGEVELEPGRRATRYDTPQSWPSPLFVSEDSEGQLLHGSSGGGGILPRPLLMVPKTVRVGMEWTSSPGANYETLRFTVKERVEADTPFGRRVLWAIESRSDGGDVRTRVYAEGAGFVANYPGEVSLEHELRESGKVEFDFTKNRVVVLDEKNPVAEPAPERLPLEPTELFGEDAWFWVTHVETSQSDAERSTHKLRTVNYCTGTGFCQRDYMVSATLEGARLEQTGVHQLSDDPAPPFVTWTTADGMSFDESSLSDNVRGLRIPAFHLRSSDDRVSHLRWISSRNDLAWYQFYLDDNGDWGWGDFIPMGPMPWEGGELERLLIDHSDDLRDVYLANWEPDGLLTHWTFADEAFSRGGPSGVLPEQVHRVSIAGDHQFYVTTHDGFIDRLFVDGEGVRRERIAAVKLPPEHTLTGVAPLNLVRPDRDPMFLVFTNVGRTFTGKDVRQGATGRTYAWRVTLPQITGPAVGLRDAGAVDVDWHGLDARVCWPPTDEALSTEGWTFGGIEPAAVIPSGEHCAVLVRDLEAAPLNDAPTWPSSSDNIDIGDEVPFGWSWFEGPIPGIGRTLVQERMVRVTRPLEEPRPSPELPLMPTGDGRWALNRPYDYHIQETDGRSMRGHRVDHFDAAVWLLGTEYLAPLPPEGFPPLERHLVDHQRGGIWRAYECRQGVPEEVCQPTGWGVAFVTSDGREELFIPTETKLNLLRILDGGRVLALRPARESEYVILSDDGTMQQLEIPEVVASFEYNTRTYDYTVGPRVSAKDLRVGDDGEICGHERRRISTSDSYVDVFFCVDASGANPRYVTSIDTNYAGYWNWRSDGFVVVASRATDGAVTYSRLDLETLEISPYDSGDFEPAANTDDPAIAGRRYDLERLPGPTKTLVEGAGGRLFGVTETGLRRMKVEPDVDWRAYLERDDEAELHHHLVAFTDRVLLLDGHSWYDRPGGANHRKILIRVPYERLEIVEHE